MWFNKTDRRWFEARRHVLTAGDIISLLPVTKTGRKRTVNNHTRLKVLADKLQAVHDDDLISYGAAARGHCLEPYAVSAYNRYYLGEARNKTMSPMYLGDALHHMYHWDHSVIHNKQMVGFSPDALDVEENGAGLCSIDAVNPTIMLEIKSYDAPHHLTSIYEEEYLRPERWQLAVGMWVHPNIKIGQLVFYNPRMQVKALQMQVFDYYREDMKEEFALIDEVVEGWLQFRDQFDFQIEPNTIDYEEIIEAELEEQRVTEAAEDFNEAAKRAAELTD